MKLVVVDLSGHLPGNAEKVDEMFPQGTVFALIQPECAGATFDFDGDLAEQVDEFRQGVELALKEAFERAQELDADAVVLVPHGASFVMAATNVTGAPVKGIPLLIAAFNMEEQDYELLPLTSVRVR